MEALQFDPAAKKLSHVQVAVPSNLGDEDVMIRVALAGVCGTDLHIVAGKFPCGEKPIVMGHEIVGIVKRVGSRINHVAVGDKVAVDPNSGCRTCQHCTSAAYQFCELGRETKTIGIYRDGGWAEYCVAPGDQVYKVPEGIPLRRAALIEPLSCVVHGWDRIQPVPIGSRVLIMGAGIIGNLWVCAFHHQGHREVIVSEPQEHRRKLLEKLETGFEVVTPEQLRARRAADPKWGVDVVVDCSGFGPAMEEAASYLNPGGKLAVFGVSSMETRISVAPYLLYKNELTILGINANPFSFNKSIGLVEAMGDRYLDYEKLGIKTFSLEDYEDALSTLRKGQIAKAIFQVQ